MRMMRTALPVPALALLAACGGDSMGGAICPAVVVPSLRVEVVDAATGANLASGATGSWVTGGRTDAMQSLEIPPRYLTAFGPAGRYSVFVQHPGYAVWGRDNVQVAPGQCGPQTVTLRAELMADGRLPGAAAMQPDR
jgi:hypothetical protein